MESMYINQVWTLIDPPEGVKPIGCKWVFKKKTDIDDNVITFKGRFATKGEQELIIRGHIDASFQSDKDDSRLQSGSRMWRYRVTPQVLHRCFLQALAASIANLEDLSRKSVWILVEASRVGRSIDDLKYFRYTLSTHILLVGLEI
ncbi:hypothetical protein CRG98_019071 [Punica granatum]|uniref:Reverse transcriptase Ty1/copia-type domain-containing protein n=1 Tax=Punica granatum TaxID=22663 RepID=A0A2I0JWD9_PUNGR|nr:hypothetical protein CRG98_019071 [Punica granatum]